MTRPRLTTMLALLFVLAVAGVALAATMSVQVQNGRLLDRPNFFGKALATLSYGESLQTMSKQGAWVRVSRANGQQGWVHDSALTSKRIVLKGGSQARVAASQEEMALAGKGFNKQVEARYRSQGRLDYATVDRMEKSNNFNQAQLEAFLGKVGLPKGGAR